jgi:hypothetical protein
MATSGFPLPLRNALAALACDALRADDARAAIAWLASPDGDPPPQATARLAGVHLIDAGSAALLDVHAPWAPAIKTHAARAARAALAYRSGGPSPADTLGQAVAQAAALWNEGLFFEVHEVLEAVWQRETGDRRVALQGLIQIAVAYHHLAHGNRRGARTLLRDGRARLAGAPAGTLPLVDVGALLAATAAAEAALSAAGAGDAPPPPPLVLGG